MPYLRFIMAASLAARPATAPQGTLCVTRDTRRLYYWDGAWTPAILPVS